MTPRFHRLLGSVDGLRRRIADRGALLRSTYRDVAFLNDLIDLPSRYRAWSFGGTEAPVYFLDYNYLDPAKTSCCLEALERVRRERGLDFSRKTLVLLASGFDPHHGALVEFVRSFADHQVIVELWNDIQELEEIRVARFSNLFVVPVTAALRLPVAAGPPRGRANRRVFVSLGGDDDLALLDDVVRLRQDVHFVVPDFAWTKDQGKQGRRVNIAGPNVTRVRGALSYFSLDYRLKFAGCDTILIATVASKRDRMRGGVRVADAIAAGKRLVLAENPMCEVLMAQHERTCLVSRHDAYDLASSLERFLDGTFDVDPALYDEVSQLTRISKKLSWIMSVPSELRAARASAFFRDAQTCPDFATRPSNAGIVIPSLFTIRHGQKVGDAGFEYCVADIRQESETTFVVMLTRDGIRPVFVQISTNPLEQFYRRTQRQFWLVHERSDLTRQELAAVDRLAALV